MKCPECKTELWLDHVRTVEDITKYFYVCPNRECEMSKAAFSPMGEKAKPQIKNSMKVQE